MIPAYGPSGFGVEDLGLAVIDGIGYVVFTSFNITQTVLSPPLSSVSIQFFTYLCCREDLLSSGVNVSDLAPIYTDCHGPATIR